MFRIFLSYAVVFSVVAFPVRAQMLSDDDDVTKSFLYNNTLWPVEAEKDRSGQASWLYDEETANTAGYYAYELDFDDSGPSGTNLVRGLMAVDDSMADGLLDKPASTFQRGMFGTRGNSSSGQSKVLPPSEFQAAMFEGPTPLFTGAPPPSLMDSRLAAPSEFSGEVRSEDATKPNPQNALPEPGTLLVVGFGLAGLGMLLRRQTRRSGIGG